MTLNGLRRSIALFALVSALGCDRDSPMAPIAPTLVACPASPQGINAPIDLAFTTPLAERTVTDGNVVVTDAATGFEIPGSVQLSADGRTVRFLPAETLPFGQELRVRIHNLRSAATQTPIGVTVCLFETEPPPITQLFWDPLLSAGGFLFGATLPGPNLGFAISSQAVIYRWLDESPTVVFNDPYYTAGFDVSFPTELHGFASLQNFRVQGRTYLIESVDGGFSFDTIRSFPRVLKRLHFRQFGAEPSGLFGVLVGGTTTASTFYKYHPVTRSFTAQEFGGSGVVNDVDFANDTLRGAAVSLGVRSPDFDIRGRLFVTQDGGRSWAVVPNSTADSLVQTYFGVAIRQNGVIFVTGGGGYAATYTRDATGAYQERRILQGRLSVPDTTNPLSLIYTDVHFAPGNDQLGWIIGAVQVGLLAGVPRYEGVIFETRDGGTTWVRQGVRGAPNYGAEFPRLERIASRTPTHVWLVGEAGTVLTYRP